MKIIALLYHRISKIVSLIPKEYRSDIKRDLADINMVRIHIISIILICINLILIGVDSFINYPDWMMDRQSMKYLYGHVIMIVERVIFLFAFHILKSRSPMDLYKFKKFATLYSTIIIMAWCGHLSLAASGVHGQIYTFIIGSFFVASLIFLLPLESVATYSFSFCIFVIALFINNAEQVRVMSNIVNTMLILAFALLMSYINISLYCNNYIHNRTIQKQSKELQEARDKLEEAVRKRTEELIKEMGVRHEIEMQSIRTKLMYEENQRLLRELKEYEELRNVFFTNLSHELRTPLNVIFSAQQMMAMLIDRCFCADTKDKLDRYNKIIKQNCHRLIRLIGNLIDITKIDAKHFEIHKRNCDIVSLVENITQSVAEYIKDKNIELNFHTLEEEKVIACDPDKIERIMLNLLSNAVKFTPESGVINVKLYSEDEYIVIAVKDNGIGISKEMQEAIFERFVQADKSTTRNREGSGIGLSLVKSLIDLHQGRISLFSEPGKGSEFKVMLPDTSLPNEDCIACSKEEDGRNIERISIEFSDIYS